MDFFIPLKRNQVRCTLCAHGCRLAPGARGRCQVRENRGGRLESLVYGRLVAGAADPVEKKPLFHVLPGSITWSIATVGCNFTCLHCQNHHISQYPRTHGGAIAGERRSPASVVAEARAMGAASISHTYVEPTIFGEFALDCAAEARAAGLRSFMVSNGFMAPAFRKALPGLVQALNIDIKAFSERFYKEVCGARLAPVLDTVGELRAAGLFIEVTTLLIPGLNDDPAELRDLARFLASLDPGIPWHLSAYRPAWRMQAPPTPPALLDMAARIGREAGLLYVYRGNLPGRGGEDTRCPDCGALLLRRQGFTLLERRLGPRGHCPDCGTEIPGIWESSQ